MNIKVSLATLYWRSTLSWIFSQTGMFLADLLHISLISAFIYRDSVLRDNEFKKAGVRSAQARSVIMNLKRQVCTSNRRVARPQATGINIYSFINFSAENSNVWAFHNSNSCETISLTSHDFLKL